MSPAELLEDELESLSDSEESDDELPLELLSDFLLFLWSDSSLLGISETSKLLLWCVSDLVQYKRSDQIYKKMRLTRNLLLKMSASNRQQDLSIFVFYHFTFISQAVAQRDDKDHV